MVADKTGATDQSASALCTACGMCCNGSLFRKVPFREDERGFVESLELEIHEGKRPGFLLPCPKLDDATCTIYPDRPSRCDEFACKLLKRFKAEEIGWDDATDIVRQARELRERIAAVDPAATTVVHRLRDDHMALPDGIAEDVREAARTRLDRLAFDLLLNREFRSAQDDKLVK